MGEKKQLEERVAEMSADARRGEDGVAKAQARAERAVAQLQEAQAEHDDVLREVRAARDQASIRPAVHNLLRSEERDVSSRKSLS